jgi:hypothetical protein
MRYSSNPYIVSRRLGPALVAAFLIGTLVPAAGKTQIEVESGAVRLSAEDATIDEVLSTLSPQLKVTCAPGADLNRTVTGVYSGTLPQILSRVLDGYDYIVKISDNGIVLNVLSRSGSIIRQPASPPHTAAQVPSAPPPQNPRPNSVPGRVSSN